MELLPSETYLVRSNDDKLVLTSHRIILNEKRSSETYSNIIFVEDIVSIEKRVDSLKSAFLTGVLLLIAGGAWAQLPYVTALNVLTLCGVLFLTAYTYSRRMIVSITPNGGQPIHFEIGAMPKEELDAFLHKVQLARMARRAAGG